MVAEVRHRKTIKMVAIAFAFAAIIVSCKSNLAQTDPLDLKHIPTQTVENIKAIQSKNGIYEMRMEAPLMEHFEQDKSNSYDLFSRGISVYGYNEEGLLETEITSDEAKHTIGSKQETWAAYGNVIIKNFIKGERMETDTIYWNQEEKKIYTDCYVKLTSPQGMMQGYGMESDEMARNAVLLRPFDSYTLLNQDTTSTTYIDSANFIGPLYIR